MPRCTAWRGGESRATRGLRGYVERADALPNAIVSSAAEIYSPGAARDLSVVCPHRRCRPLGARCVFCCHPLDLLLAEPRDIDEGFRPLRARRAGTTAVSLEADRPPAGPENPQNNSEKQ